MHERHCPQPVTQTRHAASAHLRLGAAIIGAGLALVGAGAHADPIIDTSKAIEQALQARVGVVVHDTESGRRWEHRPNERFPMGSTAKTLICATLLHQGPAALATPVLIRQDEVLSYAPVTKHRVGQKVAASELCEITMRLSDNTAANGVLNVIGGPSAVTDFLRGIGDQSTRLDRPEPDLNEATPGDPRDTSTPAAMVQTLSTLILGAALAPPARRQLTEWMLGNEVGGPLLRAGVPPDWRVADRTGAAAHGTRGVAAIMWPPGRAPIVAAVYLTETNASMEDRNAAIASIGEAIVRSHVQIGHNPE